MLPENKYQKNKGYNLDTGIRSRNNISTSTHHSASTNRCTGSKRKQVLYYGVSIREKLTTIYPYNPQMPIAMPPMLPDLFAVFYVNTENYQPLIADVYGINKTIQKIGLKHYIRLATSSI